MISFPLLGRYGRLGNQMFQFAATYTIAKMNNTSPIFPALGHDLNCFELDEKYFTFNSIEIKGMYKENESDFSFDSNFFNLPDGFAVLGYFQNLSYISPFQKEIKSIFSFKPDIIDAANLALKDCIKISNKMNISLHIRRGDYLKIPDVLPICNIDYYNRAVECMKKMFNDDFSIVVFSDDISWCKENIHFKDCFFFENSKMPSIDMAAMTLCDHHIIANSSFSWWGAWLSSNKNVVIRPESWFGKNGPRNIENMFPKSWISI